MEFLGERPVRSMSGDEMLSSLDATFAEIARLETSALHLIHGLETTGYAQELGAGTTARLLTFRYRIDATKARRDVHLATTLPKFPAVAAALPDPNPHHATPAHDNDADRNGAGIDGAGEDGADDNGAGGDCTGVGVGVLLHPAQAEAIVSALEKVPTTVAADDLQVAEQALVELGRTHGPLELRKAGNQVRDRLDTDGPEPAEQKAYDRETLTLKNADNGIAFTGYLANENAELFRTLINIHAKPHKTIDGALDPRPRHKRHADALTTILTTATNPTGTGNTAAGTAGSGCTPGTTESPGAAGTADAAHVPDAMLPDMPSDPRSPRTGNSTPADGISADSAARFIPGHGPKAHITVTIDFNDLKTATAHKIGHLTYGDALSAATIRRLACDAQILPIVLGSDSQPLDVGTTVRLATGPIRKALIARDKGCVCCGAPPIYCDAHHVISWIDGGETTITNLVLLCKRCHRDLHAGHWNIDITNGTVHVARPAWATPNPAPCGRYRPPTTDPVSGADHGSTTREAAGATTAGRSARAWPRETDPQWITPENTARLNPWGDPTDERPAHTHKQQDQQFQHEPHKHRDHRVQTPKSGPPLLPAGGFDPWGVGSDSRPRGVPKPPAGEGTTDVGVDVWGDAVSRNPTVDRRSKLGTNATGTFDPWGDLAPETADEPNPADDDPRSIRRISDPCGDPTEPHSASTTAA
ncbi:DUF222 domain-containing protein [Kribbella sp. NPDC026596]|uniref:HNH endonuclease signature motif containing protein n=1 Tax=Kribbella sp. NPDC026596 TaxID=3155122 RepID=UPI0033FAEE58